MKKPQEENIFITLKQMFGKWKYNNVKKIRSYLSLW